MYRCQYDTGRRSLPPTLYHDSYINRSTHSELARNFLLITPNIIVLDRIRSDFDGLKIFYEDPVLPDNGLEVPVLTEKINFFFLDNLQYLF